MRDLTFLAGANYHKWIAEGEKYSYGEDLITWILEGVAGLTTATGEITQAELQKKQAATKLKEEQEAVKGKLEDVLGQVVATKASVAKAKLGATLDEGQSYTAIYAVLGGTAVLVTCMLTYSYFKN
jgi:hypothetical protein